MGGSISVGLEDRIGPPSGNEPSYCYDDNCKDLEEESKEPLEESTLEDDDYYSYYDDDDDDNDDNMEEGTHSDDTEKDNHSSDGTDEGTHSSDEMAKRHPSYLDRIRNPINILWNATKKIANNIYNATVETLEDIEERVRMVLNEEAFNMFVSALGTFQTHLMSSDKLFGYTISKSIETVLSVTLLLVVIFFNYIFSGILSLLNLLIIDCFLWLAYWLFGPARIYECVVVFFIYVYKILAWVVSYPVLFSAIVITLFVLSCIMRCVWPIVRRRYFPTWYRTDSDMLYILTEKSAVMERRMNSLDEKIDRMEKMMTVVHEYVITEKNRQRQQQQQQPVHDE